MNRWLESIVPALVMLGFESTQPAPVGAQTYLIQWGTSGNGTSQFAGPFGIATDAAGNVFVSDYGNDRVQKFGPVPTPVISTSWGRVKSLYR